MDIEIRIVGPELYFWSQTLASDEAIEIPDRYVSFDGDNGNHLITENPLFDLEYSRIEIVREGAVLGRYAIEDCVLKCSGMIDSSAAASRMLFGEVLYGAGRSITEIRGHADTIHPHEIVISYKVLHHPVRGYINVFDGIEISGVHRDNLEIIGEPCPDPADAEVDLPPPFDHLERRFWRIENGECWLLNESGDDVEGPVHVASREHLNLLQNTIEVSDGAFRGCEELQTLALGKLADADGIIDYIELGRDFVSVSGVKAVLVSSDVDGFWCADLNRDCNLLISDEVRYPVCRLESGVAGREIHVNEEQFAYLSREIFGIPEDMCEHVSGRWIFTASPQSARWMISFAHMLEDDAWPGSDMALALRCYEHAKWCAERCDAQLWDEDLDAISHYSMEIDRLKDEMEELDTWDFDDMGVGRRRNVVNIRIADDVEFIPEGAFRGCRNLRSVYIPDSVVAVEENAFADCPRLISRPHYTRDGRRLIVWTNPPEHVAISPYAQVIGMGCFSGSEDLQEVTYKPVMPVVCRHNEVYRAAILPRAFANCRSLRSVVVDGGFVETCELRRLLCYDDNNRLVIGWEAFLGCSSLVCLNALDMVLSPIGALELSIINLLPDSEYVNDMDIRGRPGRTFEGCEHLEEAPTISSGLSEEFEAAFRGCRTLRRVSLCCSSGDAAIAGDMFNGCGMLTQISLVDRKGAELPAGVVSVGANAFNGCDSLTNEGINANRLSRRSAAEALAGSRLDIPREEDGQQRDEDDGEEMDAGEGQPEERIMTAREFFGEVEEEDDEEVNENDPEEGSDDVTKDEMMTAKEFFGEVYEDDSEEEVEEKDDDA